MKNLKSLGTVLSKKEQKQVFGGVNRLTVCGSGNGDFDEDVTCGGGGGPGGGGDDSCQTDADCGMGAIQVQIPIEDCPPASVALFGHCGYTTEYVQMTCLVGAGGSGNCVV